MYAGRLRVCHEHPWKMEEKAGGEGRMTVSLAAVDNWEGIRDIPRRRDALGKVRCTGTEAKISESQGLLRWCRRSQSRYQQGLVRRLIGPWTDERFIFRHGGQDMRGAGGDIRPRESYLR